MASLFNSVLILNIFEQLLHKKFKNQRWSINPRRWSVHAVIWQAGTNWADPVRIQIYYGNRVAYKATLPTLNEAKFLLLDFFS